MTLGQGVGEGLLKIRPSEVGKGIGDGLARFSDVWRSEGKFALPQRCRELSQDAFGETEIDEHGEPRVCDAGPFSSMSNMSRHYRSRHAYVGARELSAILDRTRRSAFEQAMNGASR